MGAAFFQRSWVRHLPRASQGMHLGKAESKPGRNAAALGGRGKLDQRSSDLIDHQNHLGELRGSQPPIIPNRLTQNFEGVEPQEVCFHIKSPPVVFLINQIWCCPERSCRDREARGTSEGGRAEASGEGGRG